MTDTDPRWGAHGGPPPDSVAGRDAWIWLDGEVVPAAEAVVGVMTHGLHYGYGLFEGIRTYAQTGGGSAVFRLDDHVARLFGGAKILQLALPWTEQQICDACVEVVRRNRLDACYVRPLVFVGEGALGIHAPRNPIRVAIGAWAWGTYLGAEALEQGVRAVVSSFTRTLVNTNMVRAKVTGQYVTSILARCEAKAQGADEAILLDKDGYCAEGSGENLFLVRDETLVTPPLSSPILAGITRASILELARDAGIDVVEQRFTRDELYLADEAFLTGTAAEVTPLREVDRRPIGAGRRGPITAELQRAFFAAVRGEDDERVGWLTDVPAGR